MIDSPWLGLYKVKDDQPIIVCEEFVTPDADAEPSYGCFTETSSDSEPEHSSMIDQGEIPDLSALESDSDTDIKAGETLMHFLG
jgi:hypothetical protein